MIGRDVGFQLESGPELGGQEGRHGDAAQERPHEHPPAEQRARPLRRQGKYEVPRHDGEDSGVDQHDLRGALRQPVALPGLLRLVAAPVLAQLLVGGLELGRHEALQELGVGAERDPDQVARQPPQEPEPHQGPEVEERHVEVRHLPWLDVLDPREVGPNAADQQDQHEPEAVGHEGRQRLGDPHDRPAPSPVAEADGARQHHGPLRDPEPVNGVDGVGAPGALRLVEQQPDERGDSDHHAGDPDL